jgi:hypothetical protein
MHSGVNVRRIGGASTTPAQEPPQVALSLRRGREREVTAHLSSLGGFGTPAICLHIASSAAEQTVAGIKPLITT